MPLFFALCAISYVLLSACGKLPEAPAPKPTTSIQIAQVCMDELHRIRESDYQCDEKYSGVIWVYIPNDGSELPAVSQNVDLTWSVNPPPKGYTVGRIPPEGARFVS